VNFTIYKGSIPGPSGITQAHLQQILVNTKFAAIIVEDLTNNVLQGGAGNLTLTARNAIVFQGVNDKIVTGKGNITLKAGAGGIGVALGPGHTVSIVSGGPGVTQAGDIVLKTTGGGSIKVKGVSIKSSGSGNEVAVFQANAAGNFSASGLIDVEAVAKGVSAQLADADINISAGNALTLHGIKSLASASEHGGGGNVAALADANLKAKAINDQGNASVTAAMGGHSGLTFDATANFKANATNSLRISGRTLAAATANLFSVSFENVNALASLHAGHLDLGSVEVHGQGLANKVGNDVVHASADLVGDLIEVAHDVNASALAAAQRAGFADAIAVLAISANQLDEHGNVTARASANNANHGRSASASADLFITVAPGVGNSGTLLAGNASVAGAVSALALAINGGTSKDADVKANLQVTGQGIHIGGDVVVTANGQTLHVTHNQSSTPHATATANLSGA